MAPLPRSPAVLAALVAAAAVLGGPGSAGQASGMPAAVDDYLTTDAALQATTAQLALVRTRARALSGAELHANLRLQRRLESRKDALLQAEDAGRVRAEQALTRHRAARRARAERRARDTTAGPPPAGMPTAASVPGGADAPLIAAIDAYLASKASPLTGEGAAFVRETRSVGLDPRLLVAIAGAETAFGTYGPSQAIHNPFGMGPGIVYPSWSVAIAGAARNLGGDLYLGDGRVTIPAIHERWAPVGAANDPAGLNGGWAGNVGHYFAEQGGDPTAAVFDPAASAPPASTPAASPRPATSLVTESPGPPPTAATAETVPPPHAPSHLVARVVVDPPFRGPMLDATAP